MRLFIWTLLALTIIGASVALHSPHVQAAAGPHPPIVVELFTSEGCSSCPPADRLLMELQKQSRPDAEIIVLSEHVDYWNYIGWQDPFSARQFSDRQSTYAAAFGSDEVYTPQMVVDGAVGFTGSDSRRAAKEIAQAAEHPKGVITLSANEVPGAVLSVSAEGDALHTKGAAITVAVTEDGLASQVKRGENTGRLLEHTGVVRALQEVMPETASAKVTFDLKPEWQRKNLHVVAFVHDKAKRVIAAGTAHLE